ncbi:MAG: RHS repeat-associated core domain-containing protein, partial [Candidatus Angelobacter sp.]
RTFGHFPFGETWYETGTTDKWKFTSYERDSAAGESGLDYAMFRYYSSGQGRFMSADLLAGSIDAPQSLNRYTYADNNPLNFVDPLGLHLECATSWLLDSNGNEIGDPHTECQEVDDPPDGGGASGGGGDGGGLPSDPCGGMPCGGGNTGGNGGGSTPNPPTNKTLQQQAICQTLDNVSKGAAVTGDVAGVVSAGAGASILLSGGTDSPVAGPVAIISGVAFVGLKTIQYVNSAVANWAVGCNNGW